MIGTPVGALGEFVFGSSISAFPFVSDFVIVISNGCMSIVV
jgi:hypothetical protein